jgi:hypothetical protein
MHPHFNKGLLVFIPDEYPMPCKNPIVILIRMVTLDYLGPDDEFF